MKVRYHSISLYRIIAAICILQFHIFFLVHNYDIPFEMLLSKGVQGLTALSGFLYARKNIVDSKEFIRNNIKKLLIPIFVCFFFVSSMYVIYSLINHTSFVDCYFSIRPFNNATIFSFANLYYIAYIVICYLLTPLLKKNKRTKIIICILSFTIEIAIAFVFKAAIILSTYIIGYLVGEKYFDVYVNKNYKQKVSHILVWSIIIVASILIYSLVIKNSFTSYFLVHLFSLIDISCSSIFGVASFFLFILLFSFLNNSKNYKLLAFTDKYSYYIYILNQAFISGVINIGALKINMFFIYVLIYLITLLSAYICYVINNLIEKHDAFRLFRLN